MTDVEPTNVDQGRASHPLRTAAMVIYLTLALLAVMIPQSVVNWLGDMNTNVVQEPLFRAAESLQKVAEATGAATPYRRARALFLALKGVEDD
jgi:hypothetical protein